MSTNPLRLIATEAAEVERRLVEAVDKAKDDGMSWSEISQATGIHESDLRQRWAIYIALTLRARS